MTAPAESPGAGGVHDGPIPYLQRIRTYYSALGYGAPYEWAHYDSVPFQPLRKPLAECRVALVTTAAPYQPGQGRPGSGRALQFRGEILRGLFARRGEGP